MANITGTTEDTGRTGGVAVAERVAAAHALWMSTLPTIRRAPVGELLPQPLRTAELELPTEPIAAPALVVGGAIAGTHGPISDLAVSSDGGRLVAAHYADDVVSIVDTAAMAVTATITDVPEPYRVTVADRAYVSSASDSDDAVVAIDTTTGRALAALQPGTDAEQPAVQALMSQAVPGWAGSWSECAARSRQLASRDISTGWCTHRTRRSRSRSHGQRRGSSNRRA